MTDGHVYLRAAAGLLPGRRRYRTLSDRELVHQGVEVDRSHLAAYDRVCGFRLTDALPATYPHVLAFPLAMRLMSAGDFPFPVIGLVHVANRITVTRPIDAAERMDLSVRAADLRDHNRGRQFDIVATATIDGEEVWRSLSTYLRREPGDDRRDGTAGGRPETTAGGLRAETADAPVAEITNDPRTEAVPGRPTETAKSGHPGTGASGRSGTALWRVPAKVGRDYAAVSGDRNPIHTSRVGARLFGFPRPIAHGMWSMARCLAALEGRLPAEYTVDVAFKAPILLPATVSFRADGLDFEVFGRRPHLAGQVTHP